MKVNEKGNVNRIQWLDILKGILIFFVILSHSYPGEFYRKIFTPFFLTMFFFASGYTFSLKGNFKMFLKNKFKRLICPFFMLGMIRVILGFIIEGGSLIQRLLWFPLQINCRGDEMWFVSCLFTCSILFYGILVWRGRIANNYKDGFLLSISVIIMLLGLTDICVWKIKFIWEIEIACMMVFYMALGYLYRIHQAVIEKRVERPLWVGSFVVVYVFSVFFIQNDVDIHAETFQYPVVFIAMSILSILPVVYLAKLMYWCLGNKVFCFLGRHTLFYYAFSGIGRIVFFEIFAYTKNSYIQPILCASFSALLLAWPAWFVGKYFPWMVGK